MKALSSNGRWMLAGVAWCAIIAGGYTLLFRYSFAVGNASTPPPNIPASFASAGSLSKPRLFLALHPHCPCSGATVRELAKILTRAPNSSDVTVLMFKPADESDEWLEGGLLRQCRRMNCRVVSDPEGRLAASLGSLTSGRVVLYDARGRLRYHGGITGSRGHEGDNAGEHAVIDILRGGGDTARSLPVFGCPIVQNQATR